MVVVVKAIQSWAVRGTETTKNKLVCQFVCVDLSVVRCVTYDVFRAPLRSRRLAFRFQ